MIRYWKAILGWLILTPVSIFFFIKVNRRLEEAVQIQDAKDKISGLALLSFIFALLSSIKVLSICMLISLILAGRYFYLNKKGVTYKKERALQYWGYCWR